jgi:hypothetical protein
MRRTEFFAQYNPATLDYEVYMAVRGGDGPTAFAAPVTMSTESKPQPMLSMQREQAQALMDALWAARFRPTEEGTAGQLDATRAHLADMKAIAVGALAKIGVKA